jgi:hypothetical protein
MNAELSEDFISHRRVQSLGTWCCCHCNSPQSSLSDYLKGVNRRIATLSERKVNSLHHKIMDFTALLEGDLAQRFVYRPRQVDALTLTSFMKM